MFKRIPFGLCTSQSSFLKVLDKVIPNKEQYGISNYVDDIIVKGATFQEMIDNLDYLLHCLASAGLTVKMDKATFAVRELEVFGFCINKEGQRPDPAKLSAIRDAPRPRNVRGLRSFMGLCGYYRKFIKNFSQIAAPLVLLTRQSTRWTWSTQQEDAFQRLKCLLTSAPLLALPTPEGEFHLCTDASQYALGAVLSQQQHGKIRPVAYASRLLHGPELRYSVTDKEALAVVWAVQRFRCYLDSRTFTLLTDHKALLSLQTTNKDRKLVRWGLILQNFNYKVRHVPGSQNAVADYLSRPDLEQTTEKKDFTASCGLNPGNRNAPHESLQATVVNDNACENVRRLEPTTRRLPNCASGENTAQFSKQAFLGDTRCGIQVVGETPPVCHLQVDPTVCLLTQARETNCAPPTERNRQHTATEQDLNLKDLASLQAGDPDTGPLVQFLAHGHIPTGIKRKTMVRKCRHFSLLNGILVKCDKAQARTAIPRSLRRQIIEANHDNLTAGHFGIKRTIRKIQTRYLWPGMHRDVAQYVRGCVVCQQFKHNQQRPTGFMQTRALSGVWEICHTDLCGPFPTSTKGNKYIAIFQDQYSKAIELAAIPNATSKAIARSFVDLVYARHGAPRHLSSDNGAAFCSGLLAAVSSLLGVSQRHIIAYRPQSNPSERALKDVVRMIASYAAGQHDKWDRNISLVSLAVNSAVQFSTGFAPFEILYGRNVRLPTIPDNHLDKGPIPTNEYVSQLRASLSATHKAVAKHVREAQERQKRNYDKHRRQVYYEVGDSVWLDNHPLSSAAQQFCAKLAPKRRGPFKITQKGPGDTYIIEDEQTRATTRAHADQLTLFFSNQEPTSKQSQDDRDTSSTSSEELVCRANTCENDNATDWIFCDLCDKPFHTLCIGVSIVEAEEMDFICQICRKEAR